MATGCLPAGVTVLERGWLSSNNILFVGRDGSALVDTGYVTHAEQTLALVANVLNAQPLDRVLNTHLHSDHCGGNAALQSRYPALHTQIPPGEASAVSHWDMAALSYETIGQSCPRFRFDSLLLPGTEVALGNYHWEVHAAPGHDPHALLLFEPSSRTLISADALWEHGFGVAFPELVGEPSFDDVAVTLDLIESLRPDVVIPGHGRVFDRVKESLATARRRLEGLSQNPQKHARHAIKVLIKFKLLELQSTTTESFAKWIESTRHLEVIRSRFFPQEGLHALCAALLGELVAAGAASLREGVIRDV